MASVTHQIVQVRPSTDVLFGDWTGSDLAAYITELNNIPVNFTLEWSADSLTRTRVETYDDSLQPQIDAVNAKYADQIKAESDRRTAAGITTTFTTITPDSSSS